MAPERDPRHENIDDLLQDVKSLLQDDDGPATRPSRPSEDRDATRIFDGRDASIIRGAAEQADRAAREGWRPPAQAEPEDGYDNYADEPEDAPPAQRSFVAYNSDFTNDRYRAPARPRAPAPRRDTQAGRAEAPRRAPRQKRWEDGEPAPPKRRKKRGCGCLLWLLVILAVLGGLAYGALRLFGSLTKRPSPSARKPGVSTVLIAGTDDGGLRTDTIMLVTIDEKEKTYNVLSIPRDTLTNAPYNVPKINGAYGYYGCGEAGMTALLDLVEDCVGFRPDGYVLIDWNGFEALVDTMGGIDFEVPMDMDLDGITLTAGTQHLDGAAALTVARFRAGYSLADLQRVQVQRQLIASALDQWLTIPNLLKVPAAVKCVNENTLTDLNLLNLLWLARDLKVCTAGVNETLPGSAQMIGDGSYYVLDPSAVCDLVNQYFNPYQREITTDDLNIRVG